MFASISRFLSGRHWVSHRLRTDMDSVIREGALRLLTNEGSSDVILSCQGHRLMAHKVILSMASPVFRVLLKDSISEPTVIIFPDISSNTMSLILDYIYTGSVVVYLNSIQDFLGLAKLLSIQLDFHPRAPMFEKKNPCHITKIESDIKKSEKIEDPVSSTRDDAVLGTRNHKKLPELIPLRSLRNRKERRWCSYLLPSPWCPRSQGVYGDPRGLVRQGCDVIERQVSEHDPNNNFQSSNHKPENYSPQKEVTPPVVPDALPNGEWTKLPEVRRPVSADNLSENDGTKVSRPPAYDNKEIGLKNDTASAEESSRLGRIESPHGCGEDRDEDDVDLKKHDVQKPFKCAECGKGFSQLRNYKYHRSVHEGTKEFAAECPECGKVFNDKGYLSSHMKIHRDKKEYGCPHCPKRFNQRVAYNMHLRIHTGVKPHECPTCGKSFSRKMLLKQHQRVHTGERPYSCPECGKTFADRSNMSLHARLHTGVKPYGCSICPKSFTKKHHLKTHMNFHTGLKPYACEKCGLSFSQSSNMRTHYKKCAAKSRHRDEDGGRGDANRASQAAD